MKIKVLYMVLFAFMPSLVVAQYSDVSSLVDAYMDLKGISHTHLGKGMVWMAKAGAPKGAMDGVESINILKFDDGSSSTLYAQFRASADSLFAALGAECVVSESTKKGNTEVFMERKENPTEYMTYSSNTKGDVSFLWMSGNLPSSLE